MHQKAEFQINDKKTIKCNKI